MFPEITSVITGIVLTIESHHALLSLPEFRDRHGRERQGMIVSNEVSKNGSRSMNKYLTVGKPIAVQVLRVDEESGYIDLSRKRVLEEESKQCNQTYTQYKNVRDVLTRVSKDTEMPIYIPDDKEEDDDFPCLLTLLLDPLNEIFDTVYEGMAAWETSQKECNELKDSYPEVFSSVCQAIERTFKQVSVKPTHINVHLESIINGVIVIQKAAKAVDGIGGGLSLVIVAPPMYRLISVENPELLNEALNVLSSVMKENQGKVTVK